MNMPLRLHRATTYQLNYLAGFYLPFVAIIVLTIKAAKFGDYIRELVYMERAMVSTANNEQDER